MFVISGAMSWWFFGPLDVDFITLGADFQVSLGWFAPLLSFFLTISIANAINITDGLDGLA